MSDTGGGGSSIPAAGTLAVTEASLPLPAGASTEATLVAQSAKLPATLGQKAMAASMAVAIASDQSALTISGSVTTSGTVTADTELNAAAALADAASATVSTATVGAVPLLMNATTLDRARAVINTLDSVGTGIAAAGIVGQLDDVSTTAVTENQFAPVRISTRRALLVEGVASGTAVPVSGAVTANAGTGTLAVSAASLPLPSGAATAANQVIPVTATTATLTNTASSATNVTVQASNASRKGLILYNDSTQVAYVKFGATASSTSFTVYLLPNASYEMGPTVYSGIVDAIWVAANGSMRATEW